jgi:hypothetical protein
MLMRPAEAALPYSVLCGPRKTSIRWTSERSANARAWNATGTSSTWTATLGSTPMLNANVPMPRIDTDAFTGCSAGLMTMEGAMRVRSANS